MLDRNCQSTKMKPKFQLSLIVAAMFSLTACGGGGGNTESAPPPPPPPLGVSKQAVTSSLKENSTSSLTFTVENAIGAVSVTDESVSAPNTPVSGSAQVSGNTVTYAVTAGDARLSNGQHTVSLTIRDGSRSVKVTQTINIDNVSGRAQQEKLVALKASAMKFSGLTEEKSLFEKMGEVAKLVNPAYLANESALKAKFTAVLPDAESQAAVDAWMSKADTALSGYASGTAAENALQDLLTEATIPLSARTAKANAVITELLAYTQSVVTSLPLGKVFIQANGARVSQFEGNPALGTYTDGVWSYSASYKFLTAITAPETTTCKAQ